MLYVWDDHTLYNTPTEAERSPRRLREPLEVYLKIIRTCREITKPGINSGCRGLYRSRSASDKCPACCCRNVALPAAASDFGRGTFHNTYHNLTFSPEILVHRTIAHPRPNLSNFVSRAANYLFARILFIFVIKKENSL